MVHRTFCSVSCLKIATKQNKTFCLAHFTFSTGNGWIERTRNYTDLQNLSILIMLMASTIVVNFIVAHELLVRFPRRFFISVDANSVAPSFSSPLSICFTLYRMLVRIKHQMTDENNPWTSTRMHCWLPTKPSGTVCDENNLKWDSSFLCFSLRNAKQWRYKSTSRSAYYRRGWLLKPSQKPFMACDFDFETMHNHFVIIRIIFHYTASPIPRRQ